VSASEAPAAVIDASVALKWVLPERGSAEAVELRDGLAASGAPAYVPDLFWAEAANALWRLTRVGDRGIDAAEARALLEVLRAAPLTTEPVGPLAARALEIACATGLTAYDAAYVAVAEVRGAEVWTADERLARGLEGTPWAGTVRRVGVSG
jgi:predicted nucleic acid-binding protein